MSTEANMKRLRPLIEGMKNSRADLRGLQAELEHARVVTPADVAPDVITMNSKTRLHDLDTGEEMIFTLVFPGNASIEHDKIFVVAPIGTAMLGQRVGDEFEWEVRPVPCDSGSKKCCISPKPPATTTYEMNKHHRTEIKVMAKKSNTTHEQTFAYRAPAALSVQLVGDFTHGQKTPVR